MGLLDKVIAAVTPPETDAARVEARAKAREVAKAGDWLSLVLDHHLDLEDAFLAVRDATSAGARRAAQKQLAVLLSGHSIAEESVLYPALALNDEKVHSGVAYTEQSAVKVQMAALNELDPMSQDYLDKLGHIAGAVAHHMYEEEGTWFVKLKEKLTPAAQDKLTARYQEEFERYVRADAAE